MNQLLKYIDQFSKQKLMVIGDIIADEFLVGSPERISREAPVLILRRHTRKIKPGGASNAANNINSLGGSVRLVGVIGRDSAGTSLLNQLEEKGIVIDSIIQEKERPTSLKTRILAGGEQVVKQQVVRIDHLVEGSINTNLEERIFQQVESNLDQISGVLLSDYGGGLLTPRLKKELIELAQGENKFVAVDSRYDLLDFVGADLATPNLEEAGRAVGKKLNSQQEVIEAGKKIIDKLELNHLLITQGGDGMTLFAKNGDYTHIPVANFSEVYDVTGAGDTVIAAICLAHLAGAGMEEAMCLANYGAGIVVRKSGVATVNPGELRREVREDE